MATAELLAAVSAAVNGEAAPADTSQENNDAPADDVSANPADGASDASDDTGGDAGEVPAGSEAAADGQDDGKGGDAEGEAATYTDANGRVRDKKTGLFVEAKKDAAADPAAVGAAAKKPDGTPAAPAGKAKDPVNDPIPAGLKKETSERMQTLIDTTKKVSGERDSAFQELDTLMTPIQNAGMDAEQFHEVVQLCSWINSAERTDQLKALKYMQDGADHLARTLGVVPAGVDPLSGHQDLMTEVAGGKLTRERAEEIARGRLMAASNTETDQQRRQRAEQQRQAQEALQTGRADVVELEAAYKGTDPQFAAKSALLKADTAFAAQMRAMHPSKWGAAFAKKYASLKVAPVQQPQQQVPNGQRRPAPLRGRNPAGGTATAPKNSAEAIRAAVAAAS